VVRVTRSVSLCLLWALLLFLGFASARAQTSTPGEWTGVSGSSARPQAAVYGILGERSTTNMPGSRTGSATWVDNNGRL
jgi:hypothetical protein